MARRATVQARCQWSMASLVRRQWITRLLSIPTVLTIVFRLIAVALMLYFPLHSIMQRIVMALATTLWLRRASLLTFRFVILVAG